jgi:type I restriction enzyme S subunit
MKLYKYKLGELIDVTRGASLAGEYYATEGKLIRLTLGNFDYQNGGFKVNTSKDNIFFTGDVRDEYILKKGDIITPLTEQTPGLLGSTAIIPEDNTYIQSQDVALVKCKEGLDPLFCYYLLPSRLVKTQLGAAAQQTKIRHTTPDRIKDITVFVPSIEEQRLIGKTLYSIDKKIHVNRTINRNLEAMAKQLYDYWFVQFDFPDENGKPYKSSGGKMVWNEKLKREIPEGWSSSNLRNLLNLFDYQRVPLSNIQRESRKGKYPYYGATGIMDYIDDFIFDGEYLLLAEDGSTSDCDGHPIVQYIWGKNWVNNHAHIIRPLDNSQITYFFHLLRAIPAKAIETGSIQKKISQENLLGYSVVDAPISLIQQFSMAAQKLQDERMQSVETINRLQKLRDELLPLLMNGQVSVTQPAVNCDLVMTIIVCQK